MLFEEKLFFLIWRLSQLIQRLPVSTCTCTFHFLIILINFNYFNYSFFSLLSSLCGEHEEVSVLHSTYMLFLTLFLTSVPSVWTFSETAEIYLS